jgi:glyoxylase-like metal-dependent hydrolase (beta-lactamase superfamily II)
MPLALGTPPHCGGGGPIGPRSATLARIAPPAPIGGTVSPVVNWGSAERRLTPDVSVLVGDDNGTYPSGNSLFVRGRAETVIIDPSVTVVTKGGAPAPVDAVINSHSHEDHVAGNGFFADARIHVHHEDLPGVTSVGGLMDVYGLEGEVREEFTRTVVDEFFFTPRPDAKGFSDGDVFDLGGLQVEAVHLPGHTRGHSGFRISGGVFFLSDIDLTGFGPYYGDAWSDLEDFEASLERVRHEDADYYVTFHHKGVIEGRETFLQMVDTFGAVIDRRHEAMLDFLAEPHTIDDFVAHRFIYRPHVQHSFADSVERRSATLHLDRMLRRGEAVEVEPGRFQRA